MNLDFIEIGTSNFDTLIESCTDDTLGISIEPIEEYLNQLPDKKNVIKLKCGVSDVDSVVDLYYVELQDINNHGLPSWIRGCNSILKPHPSTVDVLKERNLEHLMKKSVCEVITWDTLINRFNIESVKYLKIDTEGHDCSILRNIVQSKTNVRPQKVLFENNVLTDSTFFQSTLEILRQNGYNIIESSGENVIIELL
jgi:FkbM family methyltransferase